MRSEGSLSHGRASGVSLRPATDPDSELLFRVYASTREEELGLVDWPAEQKLAFLRQQFDAQHQQYHANYTNTSWDVIEVDGEPAGRLYVARWPAEIRLVYISLLPAYRGRGIGTNLVKDLLDEGGSSGRPVRIHVEIYNPALHLYERLGFRRIAERGPYYFLEWSPADTATAGPAPGACE